MQRFHYSWPCALLLGCLATAAINAGETQAGAYLIRYNALSADFLPVATTERYGIERSSSQGLVNISVLSGEGAHTITVAAQVSGYASTLTGVKIPISFRLVKDNGGRSWLGSFRIPSTDTLRFDLLVTPDNAATSHVQFSHDYIVD